MEAGAREQTGSCANRLEQHHWRKALDEAGPLQKRPLIGPLHMSGQLPLRTQSAAMPPPPAGLQHRPTSCWSTLRCSCPSLAHRSLSLITSSVLLLPLRGWAGWGGRQAVCQRACANWLVRVGRWGTSSPQRPSLQLHGHNKFLKYLAAAAPCAWRHCCFPHNTAGRQAHSSWSC